MDRRSGVDMCDVRNVREFNGELTFSICSYEGSSVLISLLTTFNEQAASTFPQIEAQFHVGSEMAILSISLFIFGLGFGPLIFGGLSEFLGRNLIYRGSFAAFCLLSFPVAFANNVGELIVSRLNPLMRGDLES